MFLDDGTFIFHILDDPLTKSLHRWWWSDILPFHLFLHADDTWSWHPVRDSCMLVDVQRKSQQEVFCTRSSNLIIFITSRVLVGIEPKPRLLPLLECSKSYPCFYLKVKTSAYIYTTDVLWCLFACSPGCWTAGPTIKMLWEDGELCTVAAHYIIGGASLFNIRSPTESGWASGSHQSDWRIVFNKIQPCACSHLFLFNGWWW